MCSSNTSSAAHGHGTPVLRAHPEGFGPGILGWRAARQAKEGAGRAAGGGWHGQRRKWRFTDSMVRKLVSQAAVEEMGKEEGPSAEGGARREVCR